MENKDDEYIAIRFEIIYYDEKLGILLYKPLEILEGCTLNMNTDILTVGDEKLYPMESREIVNKDLKECYGMQLDMNDVNRIFESSKKNQVKETDTDMEKEKQKTIENAYNNIYYNIYFGSYEPKDKDKEIAIIFADKTDIKRYDDSSWFYNFQSDDDDTMFENNDDETCLNMTSGIIANILQELEKGRVAKLKDYFTRAYNYLISEQFDISLVPILETDEEEKSMTLKEAMEKTKPYMNELKDLIGINTVKTFTKSLQNYLIFLNKVKGKVDLERPSLNMFFTGNPGTGKTTVARIISKILYSLGYTKNDKFKEITTKDLIGEYVGHTALKTAELLEENRGGVIFIDEAYTFADPAQEFGDEALAEILKEMEKNETTFIFAGYKREMDNFIKMNSGLESRIRYYVDFSDYTDEELLEMFKRKVKKTKMILGEETDEKLLKIIRKAKESENFGNGRFIDKLFEKIIFNHSNNVSNCKSLKKLKTITKDDITDELIDELIYKENKENEIGFTYTKKH